MATLVRLTPLTARLFFVPGLRWLARRWALAAEMACDRASLNAGHQASTLVSAMLTTARHVRRTPSYRTAFSTQLRARSQKLLQPQPKRRWVFVVLTVLATLQLFSFQFGTF